MLKTTGAPKINIISFLPTSIISFLPTSIKSNIIIAFANTIDEGNRFQILRHVWGKNRRL